MPVLFYLTFDLWQQLQVVCSLSLDLVLVPEHGMILDIAPHIGHIGIVRVIGMALLACSMDRDGIF